MVRDGLRLFSPGGGVVRVPEIIFSAVSHRDASGDGEPSDASDLLRLLLNGGHFREAGYSCQAFRQTGRGDFRTRFSAPMKGGIRCAREQSIEADTYSAACAVPPSNRGSH